MLAVRELFRAQNNDRGRETFLESHCRHGSLSENGNWVSGAKFTATDRTN
jgi:hypothetical protein